MSSFLRSRTIQAAFIGACVSALGSIGAAVVGAAMQVGRPTVPGVDPPALIHVLDAGATGSVGSAGSCVAIEGAVLRFAARYPDVARRYANPGDAADLPALATREQIAACGNPERLLEARFR